MSQIQIRDDKGNGVAGVNIRISQGTKDSDSAIFDIQTDDAGNQGWPIPFWPTSDYTLHINFRGAVDGYEAKSVYVSKPPLGLYNDIQVTLGKVEKVNGLQPLHSEGWDIYLADGKRYAHRQATNYLLFQRFLEGQDISALHYPGFNGYNVTFIMSTVPSQAGLKPLIPENYSNYFDKADEFFQMESELGNRIEATLLCDMNQLGKDHSWQVNFTERMYDILRKYNHMVQLGNEVENNGVDYRNLAKPNGIFWSRGSSLSGGQCPLPAGDYSTAHLSRNSGGDYLDAQPYYMAAGYSGYAGTNGPVITNETRGASNSENSGRRTTDPTYFRRIAAAMSGWSGGTFHADFGIHSDPIEVGSAQDKCRLAFLEGFGKE